MKFAHHLRLASVSTKELKCLRSAQPVSLSVVNAYVLLCQGAILEREDQIRCVSPSFWLKLSGVDTGSSIEDFNQSVSGSRDDLGGTTESKYIDISRSL